MQTRPATLGSTIRSVQPTEITLTKIEDLQMICSTKPILVILADPQKDVTGIYKILTSKVPHNQVRILRDSSFNEILIIENFFGQSTIHHDVSEINFSSLRYSYRS